MSSQAAKRRKTSALSFRPQKTQVKPSKPAPRPPAAVAGPSKPSARSPPHTANVSVDPKAPFSVIPNGLTGKGTEGGPFRFKVIVGSYEKILYGLQVDISAASPPSGQPPTSCPSNGAGIDVKMKPIFMFPAHISCVKAVAASPLGGKWLATGGTDETVKVWDLKRRKELGGLVQHQGSITYLSFPTRSHLLSASDDGTICLYHTRDWALLTTLRGHKGRVNSVAIHSSMKVGLSVGKDRTLRMWDIMRGKGSASMKLGKEGELVRWTPSGTRFAVASQTSIDIYSTKMVLLHTVPHGSRIHDLRFCTRRDARELLLVAAENKQVSVYLLDQGDLSSSSPLPIVAALVGHQNRVKAVDILITPTTTYLGSASSDGKVHVYDLRTILESSQNSSPIEPARLEPAAVYDTNGTRLTCLTLAEDAGGSTPVELGKRKRSPLNGDRHDESDESDGEKVESEVGSDEEDRVEEENEEEEEVEME